MDISLALGGGGVKGNAHIGVLRVLNREGFKIRAIAGTSAGGLWGSLFAAGYTPDEIEGFFASLNPNTLYNRRTGDGPSWYGLAGLTQMLEVKLGNKVIENLEIPFAVTAVDLDSARPVIIRTGRVVDAVLATIAVPGIFPPVNRNGRLMVDGGVLDPVPVALARKLAPNVPVAAIVLSPPLNEWSRSVKPRLLNSLPLLANTIAKFRVTQSIEIFMRSVDIGGAMLTEMKLQMDQPDIIIRPAVPHIGLLDHIDVHEVAHLGELAALAALPALRRATNWIGRFQRRITRPSTGNPLHNLNIYE